MRNAPADKIIDAYKKARLHDFIMSLPNEYGTEIGEKARDCQAGSGSAFSLRAPF